MLYLIEIDKHQWYIDTESGILYSTPNFNRATLSRQLLNLIKILLKKEIDENGNIKGYTYKELASKLGYKTTSNISKLIQDFCKNLNKTHCIPIEQGINNKKLLKQSQEVYYFDHTIEEIRGGLSLINIEEIERNRASAIERDKKEIRANSYMSLIFSLLKKINNDIFFRTKKNIQLPFIYIENQNKCPFDFPLEVKSLYKDYHESDSLYNQRHNSGRVLYNGSIFCLENKNSSDGRYSLGKTHYMDILDSCDYISSRIKEYWMAAYEDLFLSYLFSYLDGSIDEMFASGELIDKLLVNDIHRNPRYDHYKTLVKVVNGRQKNLSVALRDEIRDILKNNLKDNINKKINEEIYANLGNSKKIKQKYSLGGIISLWENRIQDIQNKNFSNYIAGLAFSIPLFQVTEDGLVVLLAKGSYQKATGAGAKHIVPAGMMEFFSAEDPKVFSFDDFKALICKEMLEELYFGSNITQKSNNFSRTISLFSDNKDERTSASYKEILDEVRNIVIPKWMEIWKEFGKQDNIPSKVILEKILNLNENSLPWFMVVDVLNGRPEIIKPIYFKEDVDTFLNWENTHSEKIKFSSEDDLEEFIKNNHRDFCAPGVASIYLGASYYFQNKEAISSNL